MALGVLQDELPAPPHGFWFVLADTLDEVVSGECGDAVAHISSPVLWDSAISL